MQSYEARVRAFDLNHLYRQAVVEGAGHCAFTVSERAAAVEKVMHRLDTGRWGSTSPQKLNDLASSLNVDESRFIRHNWPKLKVSSSSSSERVEVPINSVRTLEHVVNGPGDTKGHSESPVGQLFSGDSNTYPG